MAKRKPIIGGNWKMNLNREQAVELARTVAEGAGDEAEIVLCPPFVYLPAVGATLAEHTGSSVGLGAQDCYHQPEGAYTGEVSVSMLRDVGCRTVVIGHSERRHVIGESDPLINEKVLAALAGGLEVILCVGETLEQRDAGKTDRVNAGQLAHGLAGVSQEQMARVVIAYEPVWAIGTGKTATPDDAQAAHAAIRRHLAYLFDEPTAEQVRIQYGGSVKPDNAGELFAQPDIDGGLIGGASLKAQDFLGIVAAAKG